ncbi:hypothetical protein [Oscillatoria sp. HE19RPO]|nr:hypothetical protein [Oscillatoria sp. HE19RPO]
MFVVTTLVVAACHGLCHDRHHQRVHRWFEDWNLLLQPGVTNA